jgi:hypothetical protein
MQCHSALPRTGGLDSVSSRSHIHVKGSPDTVILTGIVNVGKVHA